MDIESLDFYRNTYSEYVETDMKHMCRDIEILCKSAKSVFSSARHHSRLRMEVRSYSERLKEIGERICRIADSYEGFYVTRRLDKHLAKEESERTAEKEAVE